jgi:hypothetical protein
VWPSERCTATTGVEHCWLVDPEARLLEAFALHDRTWVEVDVTATARIAPFDALEFEVGNAVLTEGCRRVIVPVDTPARVR